MEVATGGYWGGFVNFHNNFPLRSQQLDHNNNSLNDQIWKLYHKETIFYFHAGQFCDLIALSVRNCYDYFPRAALFIYFLKQSDEYSSTGEFYETDQKNEACWILDTAAGSN